MFELSPFYQELLTSLNRGLLMSIALIIPSAIGGVLIGIIAGSIRTFGDPVVKTIGDAYAAIFRGTPLVIQLFILYFGLPNIGIYLSPYVAAVVGFTLCSGAYQSEYVRGALLSIKSGQYLGGQALGFTTLQVILIKYSSLAFIVTCIELTGEGKTVATEYFRYTEVFTIIGLYYLGLVSLAMIILKKIEQRLYVPGFGHG